MVYNTGTEKMQQCPRGDTWLWTRQVVRALRYRLDSDFGGRGLHKLRGMPIVSRTVSGGPGLAGAFAAGSIETDLNNVTIAQATALLTGINDYQDDTIVAGYRAQMEADTWPTDGASDKIVFADFSDYYPDIDDAMLFVDGKHRMRALAGATAGTTADFKVSFINARDVLLHDSDGDVG